MNGGKQGACFYLDSSSKLDDSNSFYAYNAADQGGVVFAINDSLFHFRKGIFKENAGIDGGVVYSMYNSNKRALSFSDCKFIRNTASKNLMSLMSSKAFIENSEFLDNFAYQSNHGINMITSNAEIYNTKISFSEGFTDYLDL